MNGQTIPKPMRFAPTFTGPIAIILALLGSVTLGACGSVEARTSVVRARTDQTTHTEGGDAAQREQPSAGAEETGAGPTEPSAQSSGPRSLLGGRFQIEFPSGVVLTRTDPWYFADRPAHYEGQDLTYHGCPLSFAARSHGLVRPSRIRLGDGEVRMWVPIEDAERRLEVITTSTRVFESLSDTYAAVGAVVFEPDGNATDLYVLPTVPDLDGFEASGEDDYLAWQRRDPRLATCFEAAEALLSEIIPTLVATRPFTPFQTTLEFGYDSDAEELSVYQGVLPDAWIITSSMAYDARFDDLHRRQAWDWTVETPRVRARVWSFSNVSDEPATRVTRRAHLFDHDLEFDRSGCASVADPQIGQFNLCLFGTRAQQDELVTVLRTFRRVTTAGRAVDRVCSFVIDDSDGQTNVRADASTRSEPTGTIPNGAAVVPSERRGRWLRIEAPTPGWIWSANVTRRCVSPATP